MNSLTTIFIAFCAFCVVTPANAAAIRFDVKLTKQVTVIQQQAGALPKVTLRIGEAENTSPKLVVLSPTNLSFASNQTVTDTLSYSYDVVSGDFDPDGVTLNTDTSGGIIFDLAGLAITDQAGNTMSAVGPANVNFAPGSARVMAGTFSFTAASYNIGASKNVKFTGSALPPGRNVTITVENKAVTGSAVVTLNGSTDSSGNLTTPDGADLSVLQAGTITATLNVTSDTVKAVVKIATASTNFSDYTGPLDGNTSSGLAVSVRRLRRDYTGAALKVSGIRQGDVGLTLAGDLDAKQLEFYCGATTNMSTNCKVMTWYNQASSGSTDLSAPNDTEAPFLIWDTKRFGVQYSTDASGPFRRFSAISSFSAGLFSASFVLNQSCGTSTSTNCRVFGAAPPLPAQTTSIISISGTTSPWAVSLYPNSTIRYLDTNSSTGNNFATGSPIISNKHVMSVGYATPFAVTNAGWLVGTSEIGPANKARLNGYIQEAYILNSSSGIATLNNSQMDYFYNN